MVTWWMPSSSTQIRTIADKEGTVTRKATMLALVVGAALLSPKPVISQSQDEKLDITAWAVNMSNIGTGNTFMIDFNVDRWTAPEERQELIATVIESGPDALLQKLQKMPSHGLMRVPSFEGPDPTNLRVGWDLRYAWQEKNPDGGRRIVLATDRYVTWWEAANRPRTIDYPFTVIEIRSNAEGKGEGKMSIATKINFDKSKNVIELETYASEPIRLQNVQIKPRKT
jgi:hypothetical protein